MRFYPGSEAMGWLARTPSVVVGACIRMLPRLDAEEAIARTNEHALAVGQMNEAGARELQRGWSEATQRQDATPRPRVDPVAALGALGISVRRIPRKKTEA